MAISHIAHVDNTGSGLTTLAVSPATIGNIMLVGIVIGSTGSAVTVTGVSGGGVTTWVVAKAAAHGTGTTPIEVWWGVVTATGAATVTVAYSGSVAGLTCEITTEEFATSVAGTWTIGSSNNSDNQTASTTVTYPTLTSPVSETCGYYGYGSVQGSGTNGGTGAGFTFAATAVTDTYCYNAALANNTAYSPTGVQAPSAKSQTIGVIFVTTPSAPAYQPRHGATNFQDPGVF